jgi:hypothetical protein
MPSMCADLLVLGPALGHFDARVLVRVAARAIISAWRRDYNEQRPHSALDYRAPAEFAAQHRNRGVSPPSTREIG